MDDRHDDLGTWLSGWVDPLYPPPGTFDPDQAARGASSTASQLDPDFCLVAVANGQIVLTAAGEEFYERVDWSGDEPVGGRPHEDPVSPIRVNPLVRSGKTRLSRPALILRVRPALRVYGRRTRRPCWSRGHRASGACGQVFSGGRSLGGRGVDSGKVAREEVCELGDGRPDVLLFVVEGRCGWRRRSSGVPWGRWRSGGPGCLRALAAGLGGCGPPHSSSRSRPSSGPRVTVAVAAALATENRWLPHRTRSAWAPGLTNTAPPWSGACTAWSCRPKSNAGRQVIVKTTVPRTARCPRTSTGPGRISGMPEP